MRTFERWEHSMNEQFKRKFMLDLDDLTDIDYHSIYDDKGTLEDIIDELKEKDDAFAMFWEAIDCG